MSFGSAEPRPSIQHRVYDTIHDTHPGDDTRPFRIFNALMLSLICANVIAIVLETEVGKLIGSGIAVLGICLVALPAGIIAAGFVERITRKRSQHFCPHCGCKIGDED